MLDLPYKKTEIEGKTVLVTGGTGSIGYEIVKQLLDQKVRKVVVFSRDETKHFLMKKRISSQRLDTLVGDVREYRSVLRVVDKYDFNMVYHAAAMKHVSMCELSPVEAAKTNILGTQNVMDAAQKSRIPKLITISTDKAIYPTNVMGSTKSIAEKITLNAGFTCVRFGNVANSRGSVIPVFVENILDGKPLVVSDLEVTRFMMRLKDAVRLIIQASRYCQGGEVFVLKMRAFKLGDLVDVLKELMPQIRSPVEVKIGGLTPGEKLHEDLLDETEWNRIIEVDDMYVVVPFGEKDEHIKKLPGYQSTDVELIPLKELKQLVLDYLEMKKRGDVYL
jgi:UDP-N-acetylglucosamine 4,6-dehydratase